MVARLSGEFSALGLHMREVAEDLTRLRSQLEAPAPASAQQAPAPMPVPQPPVPQQPMFLQQPPVPQLLAFIGVGLLLLAAGTRYARAFAEGAQRNRVQA